MEGQQAMALLRMSQAGKAAAPPPCTWSQPSQQPPALQGSGGRTSKEPTEEVGRGRPEALGPGSAPPGRGGPSPDPSAPLGFRECPIFLPSHPDSPW